MQVQAEAHLCCQPDLDRLCLEGFADCELARGDGKPLVLQLRRARAVVKVRPTGELQIVGQCTVEEAKLALKRVARRCLRMGLPAKFKRFKVRSVRWTEAFRPEFSVDILQLARHPSAELLQASGDKPLRVCLHCGPGGLDNDAAARPEEEAGGDVRAEVSADGKVRFQGARSVEELGRALGTVAAILEEHRCDLPQPQLTNAAPVLTVALPAAPRAGSNLRRGPPLPPEALMLAAPEDHPRR